jgi:carboxymethylenebutenolidase
VRPLALVGKKSAMDNGQAITFRRPDGQDAPGVLLSADDSAPGIVLIQEWWGVNDQIRGVGRRLVDAGYRVLIPDLYRGRVATAEDEASHLMTGLDFGSALQDLAGAQAFLRGQSTDSKVAVMGFCMGGALTLAALWQLDGFAAGVCFYGIPPAALSAPELELRAPMQAHFAEIDDWCTPAAVHNVEEKLRRGKTEYELYRYNAQHGFFNETRERYDPASATDAWRRTLDFLGRHLGVQRPAS